MKKYLAFFLFLGILLPQISSAYNPQTTHAGLTEQTAEFYNLNSEIKLSAGDKELIIQGSMDEDDPAVRALNHFYDPTRNMGINNYRTAIVWATEPNNGNEFSWPESIRKYAEGDREGALIGLGHILHLIQDMTVPDHTRNDPHIGDGPVGLYTGESLYEDWARENKDQNTLRGLAIQYKNFAYRPRYLGSLEDYFKNIAGYSNSNYVSADTIDNPNNYYSNPQVIEKRNNYAYGEDSYFYDKHKLYVSQKGENNKEINSLVYKTGFEYDFSVLEEYFPRLAKMAVLSGTGVIQLFFTEAEEARADFLEAEKKEQDEIARQEAEREENLTGGNILSRIWYQVSYAVVDTVSSVTNSVYKSVTNFGSTIYNGSALAINNLRNTINSVSYTSDQLATIGSQKIELGVQIAKKVIISTSQKVILYVQEKGASFISPAAVYNPSSSVLTPSNLETLLALLFKPEDPVSNNQNLITDTIQYSGGGGHHNSSIEDEASTSTATTTDDTATSTATTTDDVATSTATSTEDIATSTDETATSTATTTEDIATSTATTTDPVEVIDIEAPEFMMEISNQCLNSSQTEICLLATTTVDFILTALSTDISFYTISIDGEEVATTSDELISMEFDPDNMYEVSIFATDNSDNISSSTLRTIDIYTHPVVINEVAWMGTATSTDDEWMELYNMTPYDIDLSGWTLNSADGTPHIDLEGEILAEDFYLLERTADTTISDITADLIYTGALGNGGEELILSFASSTVDQTPAGPWPFGDNTSKRTMERKDVTGAGSVGTNASSWINNDNWTYNGLDAGGNEIKGTPRSQNSSTVIMMI